MRLEYLMFVRLGRVENSEGVQTVTYLGVTRRQCGTKI
jgi:hypothetical protein